MNNLRTKLLTVVGATVLLGLSAGLAGWSALPAHASSGLLASGADDIAVVACAPAAGNWTDCTVTLSESVSAGGSVAAGLPGGEGNVAFCTDGSFDENPPCGINGNTAVFVCDFGCAAGTQFYLSVLDAPQSAGGANLAQQITIAGSGPVPVDESPVPVRLGPVAPAAAGLSG